MDGVLKISFTITPEDFDKLKIALEQRLFKRGFKKEVRKNEDDDGTKEKDKLYYEPEVAHIAKSMAMTDPEFERWEQRDEPDDPEPQVILLVADKQHRKVQFFNYW